MIELRPIAPEDEKWILKWLNDPNICKYNSHAIWPAEPFIGDKKTLRLGVYYEGHYEGCTDWWLCGVVSLQKIDWVSRSAELAILIGSSQGKGYGKKACELICRHGFSALNLHRIYCGTHEKNIGMQKVAEHLGMTLEGRTRQAMFKNGEYADVLHYGLLDEEFRNADCSNLQREADNLPPQPRGSQGPSEG